jgi:hypothetical protein
VTRGEVDAVDLVVTTAFAATGCAVIVAPVFAMGWGVLNAGIGSMDGDVLTASLGMAAVHVAAVVHRRRHQRRTSGSRTRAWIASLNALVVLALSASVLLLLVLHTFPDEHASLASRGYPVTALWVGIQLVAVVLAEATARLVLRWLEPASASRREWRPGIDRRRTIDGGAADASRPADTA